MFNLRDLFIGIAFKNNIYFFFLLYLYIKFYWKYKFVLQEYISPRESSGRVLEDNSINTDERKSGGHTASS